jgi:hypothetical protein
MIAVFIDYMPILIYQRVVALSQSFYTCLKSKSKRCKFAAVSEWAKIEI